ncbi:hypothetical protein PAALTS15_03827 [Paenibacillus alvei TS-15]|jgi:hypothetical protein|uniref:Uncharacterized protein n=1 Tax=Paenibacillus alvei TS-15 TaxID=1117108 RepID=S9SX37_PAEAL|nr:MULTISPECIES: hypothetical protein [Paenibacillus]EPY08673.1 hypothetical protein PAALTS15_03827 [Paenibacillus alvei TS-15]GAV15745.1 hypothetical protein PBN151_5729 [Paenibacillus sp. NAIST15-1]
MNIERVFTGTTDFKTLIISQLEKEIENIVSAAYNDKQVDIVATTNNGRRHK